MAKKCLGTNRQFLVEAIGFYRSLSKHNASVHTEASLSKMQYVLLRENHVIEKGLSLRNPRKGFGQQKVLALIGHLEKYVRLYGEKDDAFLDYPLATLSSYIDYTQRQGVEIPAIEHEFARLLALAGRETTERNSGVKEVLKETVRKECGKDFESLLYNRHSIRYFSTEKIPAGFLHKALLLAQQTPSACNRQGWLTHVFQGEESTRLVKWQGGGRKDLKRKFAVPF